MTEQRFVIDGTNIVLLHGRAHPELRYVLALCAYLKAEAVDFTCYFDANISYILADSGGDQLTVFEQLLADPWWAEKLQVVPSGTDADEWVLTRAKADGALVVSNDKYRDRARKNRWIWKRRHAVVGCREQLMLPTLGLELPVLATAGEYLQSPAFLAP